MADFWTQKALDLAESRLVPDPVIRAGIRRACGKRLDQLASRNESSQEFLNRLSTAPLAIETKAANEQHYELPPEFFELILGKNRKYSACFWDETTRTLDEAEDATLARYASELDPNEDGTILELGCGWGSLTLFLAKTYPQAKILGISNSSSQREFILSQGKARGLENIEIQTCDINKFEPSHKFDRIVSVEMFEHVRNHSQLFGRMREWIAPDGRLLIHIFSHRLFPYTFETEGADNWMGKHFFTGGVMPSHDLLPFAAKDWKLAKNERIPGTCYEKTSNAWLANLDRNESKVLEILEAHYGKDLAHLWLQRWRIFFMACAELFGYSKGREWGISLQTFEPR